MIEMHLDPLGGIAGDMFVASLLDARPDLGEGLMAALAQCPLLERVELAVDKHNDGILTGTRFIVHRLGAQPSKPGSDYHRHDVPHHHTHNHSHGPDHPRRDYGEDHHHDHVDWRVIRDALETSTLDRETIRHAVGIFTLLAEAEARVHGVTSEAVQFHEVGAWDSIADIVAASWLIARINATRWTVAPMPLGGGSIRSAHGLLPAPAPATTLLLEGFETVDDGISGERVTPTGAAIVRYLCRAGNAAPTPRRLAASGHGFGSKHLPGISNCVRLLMFEQVGISRPQEEVAVLECEIDDQTGEDLAHAIDLLRAHAGVIDVVQMPVFGKKSRIMTHLRVLAEPDARDSVIAAMFDETTTIGIRHTLSRRSVLPRQSAVIDSGDRRMRVKRVERPSGASIKVEADDLAGVRTGAARNRLRRLAEAGADKAQESK